jgi:hypothetical protein
VGKLRFAKLRPVGGITEFKTPFHYSVPSCPTEHSDQQGYKYDLSVDFEFPGDRKYYGDLYKNYKGRIPTLFNIYIPNQPLITVEYNHHFVRRILPAKGSKNLILQKEN